MSKNQKIALPTSKGLLFVDPIDILYCNSAGSYTNIFLSNSKKFTIAKNLKEISEKLPAQMFARIHRSHIINIGHVVEFINGNSQTVLLDNGEEFQLSKSKKHEFLEKFIKL